MAVGADKASVEADVNGMIGRNHRQFGREEVSLDNSIFFIEQLENAELDPLALFVVAEHPSADQNVERLALDSVGKLSLHLFPREVGQKIGNGKNGISLVLPHRHGDPLAVGTDHHAVQCQRDGSPLVFFDSAVVVGFEHRKLCFFIKGTGLEVNARRVNMGGDNPHAFFERFGPDSAQIIALPRLFRNTRSPASYFILGSNALNPFSRAIEMVISTASRSVLARSRNFLYPSQNRSAFSHSSSESRSPAFFGA